MLSNAWLQRATFLFLGIPLLLFLVGWLRPLVGLPVAFLVVWALGRAWRNSAGNSGSTPGRMVAPVVLVAGLWVALSGVGGYAFQNWDHHWRNAVFHDLISFDWPVVYSAPERGPIRMLVYYVGFWLPAAAIGKYLGWQAANAALFLWSWLGVALAGLHLAQRVASWKAIWLLVLFSGADAVGALLIPRADYPSLWPPISHLEAWGGTLQYSSFTTQLFWVFNQAIPAWLCVLAVLSPGGRKHPALLWSFCFFLSPLAAVGWLPLVLTEYASELAASRRGISGLFKDLLTPTSLAAAAIAATSGIFFLANQAGQQVELAGIEPFTWLRFVLLEGVVLLLALFSSRRHDPRWYVVGALLAAIPFVQIGNGRDFVMRASIPALMYLAVWCGDLLLSESRVPVDSGPVARRRRFAVVLMLALGAFTPAFEISRSMNRTALYYLHPGSRASGPAPQVEHLAPDVVPELEHPGRLTADALGSLAGLRDELSGNFVANVRGSAFDTYLSGR